MYHISRSGNGAIVGSVVSAGRYWDISGLCRIHRTVQGRGGLSYQWD